MTTAHIVERFNSIFRPSEILIDCEVDQWDVLIESIQKEEIEMSDWEHVQFISEYRCLIETVIENQMSTPAIAKVFAMVKIAFKRILGVGLFEVQFKGGMGLHLGKIIEMQTGEGKTFSAVLAAILNSLIYKPVFIVTFNDYLATRDANWMTDIYSFFGLHCGHITSSMTDDIKRDEYAADIVYVTAKQLGFDYLQSFTIYHEREAYLPTLGYAIIDEADAILIDEARNPLILAGDIIENEISLSEVAEFVSELNAENDFHCERENRILFLTEQGHTKANAFWKIDLLMDEKQKALFSVVNLALEARVFLQKDIDYVIKSGRIKLIDEFTGRIVNDRKWSNGLQSAVEAKEGLEIQSEGSIINSITIQHLINKFEKLSGMTATATDAAGEFQEFYHLKCLVIPPNTPCLRNDHSDLIFLSSLEKEIDLIQRIVSVHRSGQPILVGTLSVHESERIHNSLLNAGIRSDILNARNDHEEAQIIANAGRVNAVTISTNMAGRGTDIKLGGADESQREQVVRLGGLFVMGTNRHESHRIDRQLIGRAGRQGDPGESQLFVRLEDPLMQKFKFSDFLPDRLKKKPELSALAIKQWYKLITRFQKSVEYRFHDLRKSLCMFADLIEKQRTIFQAERQSILFEDYPEPVSKLERKKRDILLNICDQLWSAHLNQMSQIKDGIYMVQLGGQKPVQEFQRQANFAFNDLILKLELEHKKIISWCEEANWEKIDGFEFKIPDTTWTYVISENPFGNQLSLMLLDNSNIGLTADPMAALFLFVKAMIERFKRN